MTCIKSTLFEDHWRCIGHIVISTRDLPPTLEVPIDVERVRERREMLDLNFPQSTPTANVPT